MMEKAQARWPPRRWPRATGVGGRGRPDRLRIASARSAASAIGAAAGFELNAEHRDSQRREPPCPREVFSEKSGRKRRGRLWVYNLAHPHLRTYLGHGRIRSTHDEPHQVAAWAQRERALERIVSAALLRVTAATSTAGASRRLNCT
jgi:hypothetical protein